MDNSAPGTSAAWNTVFNNFLQGLAIPPPYHDVKVTDPTTIASFTQAYVDVINGAPLQARCRISGMSFPPRRTSFRR